MGNKYTHNHINIVTSIVLIRNETNILFPSNSSVHKDQLPSRRGEVDGGRQGREGAVFLAFLNVGQLYKCVETPLLLGEES